MLSWALIVACSGDCITETEVPYDGIDQDCDGIDWVDVDGDGAPAEQAGGTDCDDDDPDIGPFSVEVPYDGIDQDCSGADLTDADGDGVDAIEVGGTDCDDTDPRTYPGAPDVAGDDEDQSCDGVDGVDGDGDGVASFDSGGADCDDTDATVAPDAEEVWYDGVDQDCDDACDHDQDGDGFVIDGHVPTDGDRCDLDPSDGQVRYLSDCNDTDPVARDNFALSMEPAEGAAGVSPDASVSLTLVGVEAGASLVIEDASGTVLPGETSWTGPTLSFTPDAPLPLAGRVTATADWTCGPASWSFSVASGP